MSATCHHHSQEGGDSSNVTKGGGVKKNILPVISHTCDLGEGLGEERSVTQRGTFGRSSGA